MTERPAVFLDRDGVINQDLGYTYRIEDLRILPGVPEALAGLRYRGYLLVVVSNQSGVARGYYGTDDIERFHTALGAQLPRASAVDYFYYCPHLPGAAPEAFRLECTCRKPAPGMVVRAAEELRIDLARSFLVGDRPSDVECAVRAGVPGIQIAVAGRDRHPNAFAGVASLLDALPHIPPVRTARTS